VDGFMA